MLTCTPPLFPTPQSANYYNNCIHTLIHINRRKQMRFATPRRRWPPPPNVSPIQRLEMIPDIVFYLLFHDPTVRFGSECDPTVKIISLFFCPYFAYKYSIPIPFPLHNPLESFLNPVLNCILIFLISFKILQF